MTTNATSFWKFIENHHIEIPIIQRDYAQGREKQEYLRKNFLENIKQALDNSLSDSNSVLKLDFVYGSESDGKLFPLDGQQRLTTLWLLHWYVALKAGKLGEASKLLKKFTYETRISSREFCRNLCVSENFNDYKDCIDIVGFITSRTWFYSSWKQDPTIQSILRMIGGTKINDKNGNDIVDGLEELFKETDVEGFENYWKALTSENAPIIFYYLPLENFGLTDDLYIKMNARGKQLTSFENFKADFIQYITERAKESNEWSKLLNPEDGIPIKLDTTWTDIFWKPQSQNDEELDKRYFAFLNRYFLNCAIIYDVAKENPDTWKLYGKESDDSSLSYDSGFDIYSSILSEDKGLIILHDIEKLFDNLKDRNISEYLPKWFKKFDFIPEYTGKSISTLTQAHRVVFFGICRYLESCTSFNEAHFRRWLRVVCNLTENTTVNTVEAMIARMRLINELSSHVEDIYEYLASENFKIQSGASSEQLAEERAKAKQILHPQPVQLPDKPNDWIDDKEWNWEAAIIEAEGYAFFNGAIRFLFKSKDGEWDWNGFSKKWKNSQALFSDDGLYKNKSVLLRYFISKFTQRNMFSGEITFDNTQSSWRYNLLSETLKEPVDEMLCSSCFEIDADYHSKFKDKLKSVQEELVTSNLLDCIEKGCHLHNRNYNDNDIYILLLVSAK